MTLTSANTFLVMAEATRSKSFVSTALSVTANANVKQHAVSTTAINVVI